MEIAFFREWIGGNIGQSAKQCHRYNKWLHLFVNISKQMYSNGDGDGETLNNKTLDIKRFWFTHIQAGAGHSHMATFCLGCFTLFDL